MIEQQNDGKLPGKFVKIPVVCETEGCINCGVVINIIDDIEESYIETFYEGFGKDNNDVCPVCHQIGIAYDPE